MVHGFGEDYTAPMTAHFRVPPPVNEPVRGYAPGSAERTELSTMLETVAGERVEIPVMIGGERLRTDDVTEVRMPHDHGHVLADVHQARAEDVHRAIDRARSVAPAWAAMPFYERAAVFLRAADLL